MIKFKHNLILLICFPNILAAQLQMPKLCTLRISNGVSIQQVDENWNKLPFDCNNIEIHIQSEMDNRIIKSGELYACKYGFSSSQNHTVPIIGEQPGIYSVMVKRFDEVNEFKNIKVEWDETGCDVIGQVLEVQFDMTKQAKK